MKRIKLFFSGKIIEMVTLLISVCALSVSISALKYSRSAYRMSSVDYSPCINIKTSEESVRIINEDNDLFYIDSIEIIGEHSYQAIINQTEYVKEYVPFAIRDYYYKSAANDGRLDDITVSLSERYQNGTVKPSDNTVIANYNHIIDVGIMDLNADLEGTKLKFVIMYTNKRNHRSNHLYLSCDVNNNEGRIREILEDEIYEEYKNMFALSDNVYRIAEAWRDVEGYINQEIASGKIMKEYKMLNK